MTTTDTTDAALLDALAYELANLKPTRVGMALHVAGLRLWYEDDGRRRAIFLRAASLRARRSDRRYTNLDPLHIAQQLRCVLAARAKAARQADIWQDAQRKRTKTAAAARVEAAVAAVNGELENQPLDRPVREWDIEKIVVADGERRCRFSLSLQNLSETQALAILCALDPTTGAIERVGDARQCSLFRARPLRLHW